MDFNTPKSICGVCNGKGGFKKLKDNAFDTNWIDCAYCEGYGFIDDTSTEEEVEHNLIYNKYRNNLILQLCRLGEIELCTSECEGKDMFIRILPSDRKKWTTLIKHLLKFSYYSEKVSILPKQVFYHTENDNHYIDWELHITTHELSDLEGIIELVQVYNDTVSYGGR